MLPVAAVSTAVFRDGKVLLVRRKRKPHEGLWTLPGGGLHFGETCAAAAARELLEETGLTLAHAELCDVRDVIVSDEDSLKHYVVVVFAGYDTGGPVKTNGEIMAGAWHNPRDCGALACTPGLQETLFKASAMLTGERQ